MPNICNLHRQAYVYHLHRKCHLHQQRSCRKPNQPRISAGDSCFQLRHLRISADGSCFQLRQSNQPRISAGGSCSCQSMQRRRRGPCIGHALVGECGRRGANGGGGGPCIGHALVGECGGGTDGGHTQFLLLKL